LYKTLFTPFTSLNLNNPNTTDIVYLHGNNDENNYIFRTEEYEFYYPSVFGKPGNSELEEFLRDIIRQFTIIFIGFSFNDDIFVNFFQNTLQEFMERKIEFKKIHGKEDPFELPDKFVFHKNAVVTREEMENLVIDESWKNLFVDPEENELKFKTDIDMETAIEDLEIEENHKKEIIAIYKNFSKNLKDKQRLKDDLNFKLISVNQYQDYESILKELFRSLTPISKTVSDIGDAANAE
jgi:hypothetical protein